MVAEKYEDERVKPGKRLRGGEGRGREGERGGGRREENG